MATLLQDIRYALRGLVRTPGFTTIVLMTVAIGTGANAAVFSFIDAFLLRPATGVADPAHLVAVYTSDFSSGPYGESSYPDYQAMRDDAGAFSSLAAYGNNIAVMIAEGSAERVRVATVTGEFFDVAGLRPAMGRLITGDDAEPAAPRVAVVSDRLWRQSFRADPWALGRNVTIGSETFVIVGIAPAGFDALDLSQPADLWTPLVPPPDDPRERDRRGLSIIGRLMPGLTIEQARLRLSALSRRLGELYPQTNLGTLQNPADARPMEVLWHTRLGPAFRRDIADLGTVLLAATLLVLMIACANVAGLLLARATSRRREMAVRLALGASRQRIVRQLLTESLVIGVGGGAFGLLIALWLIRGLPLFFPPEIARLIDFRVDMPVLIFALALAVLASLIFGLAPALQTRHWSYLFSTRSDAAGDVPGGQRTRKILVVVQVALSCVLLVATGLLAQTAINLADADPGFRARHGLVATVELPSRVSEAEGIELYGQVLARLRALPGVEAATIATTLPLTQSRRRGFNIADYQPPPGEGRELNFNVVDDKYFDTLGIELRSGRTFGPGDRAGSTPVVVVNDVFAKRYFDGAAVGKHIVDSRRTELEIVGVIASGPYRTVNEPPVPFVYYPLSQAYDPSVRVIARTAVAPESLKESLHRAIIGSRPDVAAYGVTTLESQLAEASADQRLSATLVSICGLLATVLAAVGVYGVMAYAVVRRAREIGVRIALGARPRQVLELIAREGVVMALAGVAVGLAGAAQGVRLLQSMNLLYRVGAADVASFTGAPLLLGAMVVLASIVPIRRALRVDPMVVLRQD